MPNNQYFDVREPGVQWRMNKTLFELLETVGKPYRDVTVVCIGTDRSTGDSFGPLVGHMLSHVTFVPFQLRGTLEKPVHALSLPETMEGIDTENSLVLAVDAGVGDARMVGHVAVSDAPVRPGSGLGKELPRVGDISITGIVAMGGIAPFLMLQNAPLGMVYEMAEKTFFAVQYALCGLAAQRCAACGQKTGFGLQEAHKNIFTRGRPISYTGRNG